MPDRRLLPLLLLVGLAFAPTAPADGAEDVAGTPLDLYFKGRVKAFDGKKLTLRYDFSNQEQLKDWPEGIPFPIERSKGQGIKWFDERLEVLGNTGARHRAEWKGDVAVTCRITCDAEKDMGAYLVPAEKPENFATFTLQETYFHSWDNDPGMQHSIIKFGKQWRERGSAADFVGFRYVTRRPPLDKVRPGTTVPMSFGIRRGKLYMEIPDLELKGKDLGKRLKASRPGFYTVRGRILVDDVEITGVLDPKWMERELVSYTLDKPLGRDGELDEETAALVAAYGRGESKPAPLVAIVADRGRDETARDAAAKALAGGSRKAVTTVLDLLYSEDPAARAHGIRIVSALLGKDYGYKPKGSETNRSAAIRKINQDLKDRPELLED